MGRRKSRKANEASTKSDSAPLQLFRSNCYEGERLSALLRRLERAIESARLLKGALPEKIWIKQQFAIGVNDVTRVLERMPCTEVGVSAQESPVIYKHSKAPSIQLQAVLLASDCNPKWLTKHLPGLASSRRVPLIFVRDMKSGSLRLGEVVKLKTAIAIGVKAKGGGINKAIEEVLSDREPTKGAESDES
ncbi:hypothetical protein MRB53_010502 [Persea americana]|uniref:Uncharacterized protein n=1 Tax=Persea americana TaxID=3435 RepID=A0ACC2LS79_PERAE|nr:hypothetical protein MRB53_010502 [Persea americana]